jgi:hypothetical protein
MDLEAAEEEIFLVNVTTVGEEEPVDSDRVALEEWEEAMRLERGMPSGLRRMEIAAGAEELSRVSWEASELGKKEGRTEDEC